MNRKVKYNLLFLITTMLFCSCEDFIEPDIEHEVIHLLAPTNNLITIQLTHTFWWDFLDGTEVYNMQIVEGTFASAIQLILDTTINTNKFDATLPPGSFQWRVRGENNGGETNYTTFNLEIDSALDISSLGVVLNTPSIDFITNSTSVEFSWSALLNADDYLIEVHKNTWSGAVAFGPEIESITNLTTTLGEGVFVWGVQARNSTSATSTAFTTRTFTVDTTTPSPPLLVTPSNNSTVNNGSNTYTWTQGANTGTALTDHIYFYTDVLGATPIKDASAVGLSYRDSLAPGTYYWAVRSTDAALNIGEFSDLYKVVIP
jgi:hypothetical protein